MSEAFFAAEPGEHCSSAFIPGSHTAAAQALIDFQTVNRSADFKKRLSALSYEGVDANLLRFSKALLREYHRRGWPMFAHCYVRGEATQNMLFKQGRSKARFGQSPHNYGMAVDIVHFGKFWDLAEKQWAVLGLVGKEVARKANIKITWGGDWSFYDPAHWQLKDWSILAHGRDYTLDDDAESFKEAFARARKTGRDTFSWNGKPYSTELAK